jgi:hypothetical protein
MGNDRSCDLCGDYPCVWIVQRAVVVANDETTPTISKTRLKVGYRHMFRVVNGGQAVRTRPGMRRNPRSGPLPRRSIHGFWRSEILHLNFVRTFSCQKFNGLFNFRGWPAGDDSKH